MSVALGGTWRTTVPLNHSSAHTNAQHNPVSFFKAFFFFNSAFLYLAWCIYRKRNKAIGANYTKNGLRTHRPGGGITEIFILFKSLGRRERALALNPLVRQGE